MIEKLTPGSPGWWFDKLLKDLEARHSRLKMLDSYYHGDCALPESAESARPAYRNFQAKSRINFAQLIVDAVRERMLPVGFRTGAEGDQSADKEAWRVWQGNQLDAGSRLVHRACLSMGDAYAIVGGVDPELGVPLITPEDPRQVVTAHDPIRRGKVIAALKVFSDDVEGADRAFLYLPGLVFQAQRRGSSQQWDWVDGTPEELPHAVVPVVRFSNQPDLFGNSRGEFEDALDTLDRINHMVLQRLVIATIQAFRQRAIKGMRPFDEQGNPIDYNAIFSPGANALWMLPENAEMWESGQTDLGGILQSVRHDVQDLVATTRTPLYYLVPDAANGSAEGASTAREGLLFKTVDRIAGVSDSWERTMWLAFLFGGQQDRARGDMEVLWAPPDRQSMAERFDAATKAQSVGMPWRYIMETVLQYSPQEVDRMEAERASDAFLTAALGGGAGEQQQDAAAADAAALKAAADALGSLIRAGVDPESAARQVGLDGLVFTGAVPVSLRLPEEEASGLESKSAAGGR